MKIKNRIQEELKDQGRSEQWLRNRYLVITPVMVKMLTYDRCLAIRNNSVEVRLCELYYIAKALGIKNITALLILEKL